MPKKATFYVGDEELSLLRKLSKQERISQGAIVTRALRHYVRARAFEAPSIGAGRSGRTDLSKRSEYLLRGLAKKD